MTCIDHGMSGDKYGYSRLNVKIGGVWRTRLRHRVVYAAAHGLVEHGMPGVIRHTCDNPRCVNPAHLLPGTQADNSKDMVARNRQSRGTARPLATLTEDDVLCIREDTRTQRVIAAAYGVAQVTVSRIKSGARWGWVDKEGRWNGSL